MGGVPGRRGCPGAGSELETEREAVLVLSWYREEGRLRLGGQPGCRGPGAWKPAGDLLIGGVGVLWGASACVGGGGGLCRVAG